MPCFLLQNITSSLTRRLNRCKTLIIQYVHTQFNMQISSKVQSRAISTLLLKKVMRHTVIPAVLNPSPFISMDASWLVQNILNLPSLIWCSGWVNHLNYISMWFSISLFDNCWNIYSQYTSHFECLAIGLKKKAFSKCSQWALQTNQANVFANFSSKSRPKVTSANQMTAKLRACSQIC